MIAATLKNCRRVLCLGAHSDDIEIGCGGTLMSLMQQRADLEFHWVVFSANAVRKKEAQTSAKAFLKGARKWHLQVEDFRESFFPDQWAAIKRLFQTLATDFAPDLIFTHYGDDAHQDHRVLHELTWNAFRDHLILEYEIPKFDGDLGRPNTFVKLAALVARNKCKQVCRFFKSQSGKHWFSEDTFLALLRLRGIECGSSSKYAEAFYTRKLVLG